jgi:hypothetical protein
LAGLRDTHRGYANLDIVGRFAAADAAAAVQHHDVVGFASRARRIS